MSDNTGECKSCDKLCDQLRIETEYVKHYRDAYCEGVMVTEQLRDLLKECKKVMKANNLFRGTLEHKDLSRRISIALAGLTKVKR